MKRLILALSLAALLATPGAALADSGSGVTAIDCCVPSAIEVDAPDPIDDWELWPGDNTKSGKLTVKSNLAWNVQVMDDLDYGKPQGSEGKMVEWTGSAYAEDPVLLANALRFQVEGQDEVTLGGTAQGLWSGCQDPCAVTHFDVSFKQQLDAGETDAVGKNFHIVVTFVAATCD